MAYKIIDNLKLRLKHFFLFNLSILVRKIITNWKYIDLNPQNLKRSLYKNSKKQNLS